MTTGLDSVERTLAGPSFDEWLANHAHREMEAAMQRKQRKQREGELKQRRQVESAQLFEQWLSRKSYFEKAVEYLQRIDKARCSDSDKWFQVGVALASVEQVLGGQEAVQRQQAAKQKKGAKIRSLADHYFDWSRQHEHSFADVRVSAELARKLTASERERLNPKEDGSFEFLSLPWTRKVTRPDEKIKNALYISMLRAAWRRCHAVATQQAQDAVAASQSRGKSQLERVAEGKSGGAAEEAASRRRDDSEGSGDETVHMDESRESKLVRRALVRQGVRRLKEWVEEDREVLEEAKAAEEEDHERQRQRAHEAWVRSKDRVRIRLPPDRPNAPAAARPKSPPRFDFSKAGVRRPRHVDLHATSYDMLRGSGLRYVHATQSKGEMESEDLKRSRQQLVKAGAVYKENFVDEDGDMDHDRYAMALTRTQQLRASKPDHARKAEMAREQFEEWTAHKAMIERALKYLASVDPPAEAEMEEAEREGHWRDVGKALKRVDSSLLNAWTKWTGTFRPASACSRLWEGFKPTGCLLHGVSATARDTLIKLLKRQGVNYREAFRRVLREKARREGDEQEEEDEDDVTEEGSLSHAELRRMLVGLGLSVTRQDITRLVRMFDADDDGRITMREFLDFFGDERTHVADARIRLAAKCLWDESRASAKSPASPAADGGSALMQVARSSDTPASHPEACQASHWGNKQRSKGVSYLRSLAADNLREEAELRRMKQGGAPKPPQLTVLREGKSVETLMTSLHLQWSPSADPDSEPVAFFLLETCGAEGSAAHKAMEYQEVLRDPPAPGSKGTGEFVVRGLQPNVTYIFRLRAYNGHGASPASHGIFTTEHMARMKRLRQLFRAIDADNSGQVSREELLDAVQSNSEVKEMLQHCRAPPAALAALSLDVRLAHTRASRGRAEREGEDRGRQVAAAAMSLFDLIELDDNDTLSWEEFSRFFMASADGGGGSSGTARPAEAETRYVLVKCVNADRNAFEKAYSGKESQCTLTNLQPGTAYQFKVAAVNRDGVQGEFSPPAIISTALHAPAAPALAPGKSVGTAAVHVRWAPPSAVATALLLAGGGNTLPDTGIPTAGSTGGDGLRLTAGTSAVARATGNTDHVLQEWVAAAATARGGKGDDTVEQGALTTVAGAAAALLAHRDAGVSVERLFARYDVDGSGRIDRGEFRALLQDLGAPAEDWQVRQAFNALDADKTGAISLPEFKVWLARSDVSYVLKRDEGVEYWGTALLEKGKTDERYAEPLPAVASGYSVVAYRGHATHSIVQNLAPNTLYRFRVRVVTPRCASNLSQPLAVHTAPCCPSAPAIIAVGDRWARVRWYMPAKESGGVHSAEHYVVQAKFLETLPSADATSGRVSVASRGTTRRPQAGKAAGAGGGGGGGAGAGWEVVWEGTQLMAGLSGLLPNSVYRLRVLSVNSSGVASHPSPVSQLATLAISTQPALTANNAAQWFTIECTGDVVEGDTVLFTERVFMGADQRAVTENGDRDPAPRKLGKITCLAATPHPSAPTTARSVHSASQRAGDAAPGPQGEYLGERTVAAVVVRLGAPSAGTTSARPRATSRATSRAGSRPASASRATSRARLAAAGGPAAAPQSLWSASVRSGDATPSVRVATLQVEWCTVSRKSAEAHRLSRGAIVHRRERGLFRYETFRTRWVDEALRVPAHAEAAGMAVSPAEGDALAAAAAAAAAAAVAGAAAGGGPGIDGDSLSDDETGTYSRSRSLRRRGDVDDDDDDEEVVAAAAAGGGRRRAGTAWGAGAGADSSSEADGTSMSGTFVVGTGAGASSGSASARYSAHVRVASGTSGLESQP